MTKTAPAKTILSLLFLVASLCGCVELTTRHQLGIAKDIDPKQMSLTQILRPETKMHTRAILKIAVDDGKKYLVTGSLDKTARIWNLDTGLLHKTLRVPIGYGNEGDIYAVAISPNGDMVAVSGWTGIDWQGEAAIYVFDTANGRLVYRISGLPNVVHDLAFSKLGTYLVAAVGGPNGVYVYRTLDYTQVARDRYYGGSTYDIEFNSLGRLATACADGYIRLYNRRFELVGKEKAEGGETPYSLSFSPDGTQLVTCFANTNKAEVLASEDLSHIAYLKTDDVASGQWQCVCWGSDGSIYAAGSCRDPKSGRKYIRRWYQNGASRHEDIAISNYSIHSLFPLFDGSIAFATADPSFGVLYNRALLLHKRPAIIDFRGENTRFLVSPDGLTVKFSYDVAGEDKRYFSLESLAKGKPALTRIEPKENGHSTPVLSAIIQANGVEVSDWRNSREPKLNGRPLPLDNQEFSHSLAISEYRQSLVLGTDFYLRCFDFQGRELWRTPLPEIAYKVNIARSANLVWAALADGTIHWYSLDDGKELVAFFPHRLDHKKWVVWTPEGKYSGAENSGELLVQHKNRGVEVPPDALPVPTTSRRDEAIAVAVGLGNPEQEQQKPASADENSGNFFDIADTVVEFSLDDEKSEDKPILDRSKPSLYILAIGVSKYRHPKLVDLDFADKDAQDFITAMARQEGDFYNRVHTRLIVNGEATRINVLQGLHWIQTRAGYRDMAMVFLSGHGDNDANGFYYFLPTDVQANARDLPLTAVSFAKIQETLASLNSKSVFFMDTCRSGGVFSRRRIDIDNLVETLSRAKSKELVIFASSSGEQLSLENPKWNNGAFTKALLEGISGKSDVFDEGKITISNLYSYVSYRVKELTNGAQTPTIAIPNSSENFVIANVKKRSVIIPE